MPDMLGVRALSSSNTRSPQPRERWLSARPGQLLAIIALALAAVVLVVCLWLGFQWIVQTPYLGVMLSPSLEVLAADSMSSNVSPAVRAGILPGDQVVAIGGELPESDREAMAQVRGFLAGSDFGDRVTLSIDRVDTDYDRSNTALRCREAEGGQGLRCAVVFALGRFPLVDALIQFVLSWLVGVGAFVLAVFTLRWYGDHPIGRHTTIIGALLAMLAAGVFDFHTARVLSPLLYLNVIFLLGGMFLVLLLSFPSPLYILERRPGLQFLPPVITIAGLAYANSRYLGGTVAYTQLLNVAYAYAALMGLLLVGMLLRRVRTSVSSIVRDQCAILLAGMLLAGAPLLVWLVSSVVSLSFLGNNLAFHFSLVTPFFLLLPGALLYAMAQAKLPQSGGLISQGIVYSIMAVGIALGYGLLVAGATLLTGSIVQANNPLVLSVTVFLTALLFVPVRNALERRVDLTYYRARRVYQNRVEQFTQDLTKMTTLAGIVESIRHQLNEALAPTHIFLFFPNEETQQYIAYGVPTPETDVRFDMRSPLIQLLSGQSRALYLEPGGILPPELASERARLAVLGATVFVPLRGLDRLTGMMVVGPRQAFVRYHHDDLAFMQALADQAALASERAQVITNLEQRVREMNVLGQVAQAVNFTVEYEDLLELIYAQTNRVISAPNFFIVLRDPNADELYYALYSERDERIAARENVRWRIGRDLISEVARGGQPLRIENYTVENTRRGAQSDLDVPEMKAWMGVPLHGPAGVIGVMCVGSTDISVTYTDEQLRLMWQIADQAATAIDKARLFRETEMRARQLTALNEISTQLATVFQDTERLLELITESAALILDAEAGSLLMMDPETQELEFKVATGPGAEEIVGTRLSPGTGVAGTVAARGEPIIVNDTTRDPRWFSGIDDDTSVKTSTLMAAPLMGNTGVIGVLEVINKSQGGVFVDDDKRLLTTFAGQAAIAIENARLFQMTDQQLAARVEELDTMQKIDRELNETINLQRVLGLTLNWAMRESGAQAGALGMVLQDGEGLRIMTHSGYPPDSPVGRDELWPMDRGIVGRVVRSGQPELVADVSLDADYVEGMPGVRCQITVPMFSGGEASGVIILESAEENAFSLLDLDFVSRLAEHASPAMSNSLLFTQLERANEARSEFVGFVAHELKTPMTSIKGFADLLIGGVVGPLNDQQKNFLNTIRSNVERMNTLVSDLNDVTKLQTDRMYMEMKKVDFNAVVEETLRPLENQIESKGQKLVLEMRQNLPPVYADHNRLIQVLTNLVTNAHKYTPENGTMTIHASPSPNIWNSTGADEVLHVYVKDDGIGISEEDIEKLFTPYFRTTNPLAMEQPGTGLGLVIVRGIVEQHGGQIWVESELDQGSTFHLTIPLASAVPEAQQAEHA